MREAYRGGVVAGREGQRWRRETKWIVLLQIQFLIAGGREEGEENSQRKRRGRLEISRLTIKTCLQGLKKKLCGEHINCSLSSASLQSPSDTPASKASPVKAGSLLYHSTQESWNMLTGSISSCYLSQEKSPPPHSEVKSGSNPVTLLEEKSHHIHWRSLMISVLCRVRDPAQITVFTSAKEVLGLAVCLFSKRIIK